MPNTFCGQRLVYWGKTTSAHPEWHFELCLGSPDLLFYCNGIALQPVPAYWVLRLSPLQFKQVWHSDKLFSFVLGHKMSPKNLPKCNVLWLGNAWVGKGNAGLNIFDWLIFTLSRWINYVFCNSLAIPYTRQTNYLVNFLYYLINESENKWNYCYTTIIWLLVTFFVCWNLSMVSNNQRPKSLQTLQESFSQFFYNQQGWKRWP